MLSSKVTDWLRLIEAAADEPFANLLLVGMGWHKMVDYAGGCQAANNQPSNCLNAERIDEHH